MISKQTFIDIEPSPFKTCVYFVLVTLYLRWYAIPPCATLEKMMIAHTFRVEISSFPDPHQYGLSIVTLLIPKSKCEPHRLWRCNFWLTKGEKERGKEYKTMTFFLFLIYFVLFVVDFFFTIVNCDALSKSVRDHLYWT